MGWQVVHIRPLVFLKCARDYCQDEDTYRREASNRHTCSTCREKEHTVRQSWLLRFRKSPAHTQANIVCTALIMIATFAYATVAEIQLILINRQIAIRQGTLNEATRSGQQSTWQMWQAVGNINWMARSMDQSSKDT